GISFYRGTQFPAGYRGDAFVVQHGSWNRTIPDGYRVMRIRFDPTTKRAAGKEIFASGWLQGDDAWGRPVDVKELADGSLLVSDDRLGVLYRITYRRP
ncbi:MAG: PQQ-dependent sugar dehydrogenase, partial [Rhodospirillales bacterium]